jgi:hypothetical protein
MPRASSGHWGRAAGAMAKELVHRHAHSQHLGYIDDLSFLLENIWSFFRVSDIAQMDREGRKANFSRFLNHLFGCETQTEKSINIKKKTILRFVSSLFLLRCDDAPSLMTHTGTKIPSNTLDKHHGYRRG